MLVVLLLGCTAPRAAAVEHERPGRNDVAIVVPFPAGGGAGAIANALRQPLAEALRAEVTVEHQPGEDGQVAARAVAAATPDGHRLLLGSTSSLLAPGIVGAGRVIDPVAEFEPIVIVGHVPRVIAVHASVPVRTMDDLVRLARSGGELRCGFSDALAEFAIAEFARLTATTLRCVDYDGLTPRFREDVISGRVDLTFETAFLPEIRRGALRAIAVTSPWRLPSHKDVPTASEAGVAGLEAVGWLALLAPRGTPPQRIEALREAAQTALAREAVRTVLEERGYVVRPLPPGQMRAFLQADTERWRKAQLRRAHRRSGPGSEAIAQTR
jgi:tripartite-type tricarboxylate transporter receptor subunit TctC